MSGLGEAIGAYYARMFIAAIILAIILGAGLMKGCDYVWSHYSVKVEKKK